MMDMGSLVGFVSGFMLKYAVETNPTVGLSVAVAVHTIVFGKNATAGVFYVNCTAPPASITLSVKLGTVAAILGLGIPITVNLNYREVDCGYNPVILNTNPAYCIPTPVQSMGQKSFSAVPPV